MNDIQNIHLKPIGEVRTPYRDWAPHQPVERDAEEGKFRLVLSREYSEGLRDLERFTYVYVLTYLDRQPKPVDMTVSPPWAKGKTVGLFASRSPGRPNPIGLSIVQVLRVEGSEVIISPIDFFDRTPILDIKPYFQGLDSKTDANHGWADDLEDREHIMQHVRGLPHKDHHGHDHGKKHDDGHNKKDP